MLKKKYNKKNIHKKKKFVKKKNFFCDFWDLPIIHYFGF